VRRKDENVRLDISTKEKAGKRSLWVVGSTIPSRETTLQPLRFLLQSCAVMPTVNRDGLNIVRGCLARSFRQ